MIANIIWRPHLGTLAGSLVVAAIMLLLCVLWYRYRSRYTVTRSCVLLVPKILIAVMLLFALLDPCWRGNKATENTVKVGILNDVSTSMDVEDDPSGSRAARARQIAARFDDALGDTVEVKTYQFDTDILDPKKNLGADTRGTDLGRTLVAVSEEPDLSDCKAAVLVTDGGDQVVASRRIRGVPIYIVGVGTDPSTWNDLSIGNSDTPAEVEVNTPLKVTAEIHASSATSEFLSKTDSVEVSIERLVGDDFQTVRTQSVDWDSEATGTSTAERSSGKSRQVEFELPAEEKPGTYEYRFAVNHVDGEMTYLNNQRSFQVDVRKKNIPVLLYGLSLDWNFTLLRKKLDRDPTISLTAVYRKNSDIFRIEGSRRDGDEVFRRGFPTDEELLKPYKCVILGSFRAELMRDACFEALRKYVEDGGSVVFLGGRESFGKGGYHRTPAAPLIPWQISGTEQEIRAGEYPVMVPPEGTDHGMTSATAAILEDIGSPLFYSVNHVPSLRGGALGLINASVGQEIVSVVALQPYGKGQTLGVATDTLWRWSRMKGNIGDAYHQFWRDAIRYLAGEFEGDRFLGVKWDQKRYLPSEQAVGDIRVSGRYAEGELHVKGTVQHAGETKELSVISGEQNTFRTKAFFPKSGEYAVTLEATLKGEPLGTYEHTIRVGSELNEGAQLAVDHPFLENLAAGSGGYYKPEQEVEQLVERLQAMIAQSANVHDIPLLSNPAIGGVLPVFVLVTMLILLAEWLVRRRLKMV
jgi:uncharacterized membrane protein